MAKCPICAFDKHKKLLQMKFRYKPDIPSNVEVYYCEYCDFSFTYPRNQSDYDKYYRNNSNDKTHRANNYVNNSQLKRIENFIKGREIKSILDYGCGGGGLLNELSALFPKIECVGFDVNENFPASRSNLRFTKSIPTEKFDFLIASHVIEHVVDLDIVRKVFQFVEPGGYIYIEVPDTLRYVEYEKPQFLYYIDRVHVNHFSQKAILKLAPNGFEIVSAGTYAMPYNLGDVYPCRFMIMEKNSSYTNIQDAMIVYINNEFDRAAQRRKFLRHQEFYVYGYGDNYSRNAIKGGVLYNLDKNIIGFIDKNASQLNQINDQGVKFIDPNEVDLINGKIIVCTVTQFEPLDAFFAEKYPFSKIIYI